MAALARPPLRWLGLAIGFFLTFSGCGPKVTAPPEPPGSVSRGDQAFRYHDYGAAVASYRTYLDQGDRGPYTVRTFYKTALAQYRLGQYEEALKTLDELWQRYPKQQWVQVPALRGDIERAMGHPVMALQAWDDAWKIAEDADRPALRQRILVTVRLLNDVELASAERAVTSKEVREMLDKQIALHEPLPINEPVPAEGEQQASAEEVPVPLWPPRRRKSKRRPHCRLSPLKQNRRPRQSLSKRPRYRVVPNQNLANRYRCRLTRR
jgi:hypothetical protein